MSRLRFDFKQLRNGSPPVVLLGGLNLIRPLGLASIPVIVATQDPKDIVLSSKYLCGSLILPSRSMPVGQAAEALLVAGEALARAAGSKIPLFYGSDDSLALVYQFSGVLSRYYDFLINSPSLALALLEKDRFDSVMRSHGLPVPRSLSWEGEGAETVARADFPLIVKPKQKTRWHESPIFRDILDQKGKAVLFDGGRDLLAHSSLLEYKDDLIVQEYIPGGDDHIHSFHGFADETSKILAHFSGRKIRTFPKRTGESSFLELVKDEELTQIGKETIANLGFKGIFKIDLKKHSETGKYYIMEINARFTLWNYLGAVNGVNLPLIAYEYLVSQAKPAPKNCDTVFKWLDLRLDYRAFRELRSLGELNLKDWLESILLARKVHSVFSWKDPRPFFTRCWRIFLRLVGLWRPTGSSRISTGIGKP